MKLYYATEDEMFVKKGQQVWPREEAIKGFTKPSSLFGDYAFWTIANNSMGGWVHVNKENIPLCVETADKDEFREWLVGVIRNGHIYGLLDVMEKYDALHAPQPAPQEPKPLFEVGEKVVSAVNGETGIVLEIRKDKDGYGYRLERLLGIIPESCLRKSPKTKLVFSLEKWVEKRMKGWGAGFIVSAFGTVKGFGGKTKEQITKETQVGDHYMFLDEPDLFVEVEDKQ